MEGKVPVGLLTTVSPVLNSYVDAVCACHGQTSLQSALSHSYFDVPLIERKTDGQHLISTDKYTHFRKKNILFRKRDSNFIVFRIFTVQFPHLQCPLLCLRISNIVYEDLEYRQCKDFLLLCTVSSSVHRERLKWISATRISRTFHSTISCVPLIHWIMSLIYVQHWGLFYSRKDSVAVFDLLLP